MNIINRIILILSTALFINTINAQIAADDIVGVWMTPENLSAIKIYKNGLKYNGRIIWEKKPYNELGTPKKDINNPDPKKRNRTLKGLVIIKNLQFDGKKGWIKGNIYNPESGNTYKIKADLLNKNTLKLRGYVGFSLIGKSSVWKRKDS